MRDMGDQKGYKRVGLMSETRGFLVQSEGSTKRKKN